ncbi:MAG: dienelactone hydrolase family protein [Actinomycetota bacterium]|nr:MAG: dienelactone hydrolase family protein [Actinomycetota bacterium]
MSEVEIPNPAGALPAYLSLPKGSAGPWPGVVVVHDVFGMSEDLRRQCDWLAGEGFAAVAPDLFSRRPKAVCVVSAFRQLSTGKGELFNDLDATRAWLERDDRCTGRIGVIGFCMGGSFALLLAPSGGYEASSVNYGRLPADAASYLKGSCPIVGSYGARDRSLRGASDRLTAALDVNGVAHDVKEYPSAGHGFLNDHPSRLLKVLGPFMGMGYHRASAQDAMARIVAFFNSHLLEPPALSP